MQCNIFKKNLLQNFYAFIMYLDDVLAWNRLIHEEILTHFMSIH
jgi:hypothetical protein